MTISISKKSLENASKLVAEVKEAFNTSVPPVCITINNRDEVKAFATIFKSAEHSYHGKRITCKNAKSFAPSTYAAAEIYTLESDRFPIDLFFKSIEDVKDFADGYLRAVETIPAPIERVPEVEHAQKAVPEENAAIIKPRESDKKNIIHRHYYEVNPFAETLLDTMLKIMLTIGWILAIGSIGASIYLAAEMEEHYIIVLGILAATAILLTYYFVWAINKVVINMSRSLYNINESLKDIE